MIHLNKCDCCGTPEQHTECDTLVEPYATDKVKVVCVKCLRKIQDFVDQVRTSKGQEEIRIIRNYINKLHYKPELTKYINTKSPIKELVMKIMFTLLFYVLLSFIALIGVTGTLLIYKGLIPSMVILTTVSCWFLLTYCVIKNTYNRIRLFCLTQEEQSREQMEDTHYNALMNVKNNKHVSEAMKNPWS